MASYYAKSRSGWFNSVAERGYDNVGKEVAGATRSTFNGSFKRTATSGKVAKYFF